MGTTVFRYLPIVDPRIPPSKTPMIDPIAPLPPNTAKACVLSGPTGYVVVRIATALGIVKLAPMPWRARPIDMTIGSLAKPLTVAQIENQVTPRM
jgi:hypothetical protein